jgi:hypothetical protein
MAVICCSKTPGALVARQSGCESVRELSGAIRDDLLER